MSEQSTTPDLVELTRALLEVANRHDLDAMLSFYAPNAIWESPPLGASFKGVDAIRGFYEDWLSAYEELEFELEEILDLGHGVIFAVARQSARPVGSIGRVRARPVFISERAEGMVVRVTVYYDIDEARASAERLAELRG
jgi:ketosteroid isomerase-like protein